MTITIRNQEFVLHTSGALFWEARKWLLISDVHLGKVPHFRKHGIAVPNEAGLENFKKLTDTVAHFRPEKLIFMGDLFHSSKNSDWDAFEIWAAGCGVSNILLIAGNHDIINKNHYAEIGISVVGLLETDGFLLTHHPSEKQGVFNFSGHIHPGILLRGLGGQSLRLPCFLRKEYQMILPAFGAFTGKSMIRPGEKDIVYAIAGDGIVMIDKK